MELSNRLQATSTICSALVCSGGFLNKNFDRCSCLLRQENKIRILDWTLKLRLSRTKAVYASGVICKERGRLLVFRLRLYFRVSFSAVRNVVAIGTLARSNCVVSTAVESPRASVRDWVSAKRTERCRSIVSMPLKEFLYIEVSAVFIKGVVKLNYYFVWSRKLFKIYARSSFCDV